MKMKKLTALFLACVLAAGSATGAAAAEFDDGQNAPDFSSAEQEDIPETTVMEPETVTEEIFSDPESAADASDTPELSAINDRFAVDGFRYKEIASGKVQLQDGSGASGMVVIPAEITVEETGKTYTVVSIGEDAFYQNKQITGVTFPDTITSIGPWAFQECESLTGELKLPESLESIDEHAFYSCTGLTGLTLPDNLKSIGERAFYSCTGIKGTLTLPDSIKKIGLLAFWGCTFTCETGSPELAQQAYEAGCKNVTINGTAYNPSGSSEPSLPVGYIIDEKSVFEIIDEEHKYVSLRLTLADAGENLVIPESVQYNGTDYRVTEISDNALLKGGYTGELKIPESITSIGAYAFAEQDFTGSLILPEGLTSIGDHAFGKCDGFNGELKLPESLTSIGDYAFYGCDGFTGELHLPEGLTSIGECTFYACSGFTGELHLPEGLTSIGTAAFFECSGFTGELILSDNIINVGNSAFWDCTNIKKIHVGSGLLSLTVYSFPPCEEITTTSPRVQLLLVEKSDKEKLPLLLWDGREDVLSGAVGSVVEDITINGDITIEEGAEIRVTEGHTITVAGSLTNHGTLFLEANASVIAAGNFTDNGTVTGSGTVVPFGKPELDSTKTKINGNKVSLSLTAPVAGAEGYDYIISRNPNCLREKDYLLVNKNTPYTNTTFRYLPKGVCYAAVQAWVRNSGGKKVFSPWSKLVKLKITADMPSTPKLKNVKVSGSTVTITYTKSAKAAGYDLVLGKRAKKVNGENRPVEYGSLVRKVTNGNIVTATFKNVPKGTYYAGLHAWNRSSENKQKVFSKWSDVKKVVVK